MPDPILRIEADFAFGPVVTIPTMEQAIAKAREVGIGWALIRNTTHQGALGYYAQMATRVGMVGIVSVCNPPNMAPPGAKAVGTHNTAPSPLLLRAKTGKRSA